MIPLMEMAANILKHMMLWNLKYGVKLSVPSSVTVWSCYLVKGKRSSPIAYGGELPRIGSDKFKGYLGK